MANFTTSDTHFFHTNILVFNPATRPYGRPGLVADMKRLRAKDPTLTPSEKTKIKNDIEEAVHNMNEAMIADWNSKVGPDDTVYHLGDFSFGKPEPTKAILWRLNGKIRLVRGNHDPKPGDDSHFRERCEWIRDYYELRHGEHKINMMHFPMAVWNKNHHGALMLHGHCHGSYKAQGRILDVGWDSLGCVTAIDDIVQRLTALPIHVADHHGEGVD